MIVKKIIFSFILLKVIAIIYTYKLPLSWSSLSSAHVMSVVNIEIDENLLDTM